MRGLLFIASVVASVSGGCATDEGMKFTVYVELTPQIDRVEADGVDVAINNGHPIRSVSYEAVFSSYAAAMASPPVTLDFSAMGQVVYVGQARPGLCHARCAVSDCPSDGALTSERVEVALGNFTTHDFLSVTCSDAERMVNVYGEAAVAP